MDEGNFFKIMDFAVEENIPPNEYFSQFDIYGEWQLEIAKKYGLEPGHLVLDVGCGAARGGYFVGQYIESGNYYGIDPSEKYCRIANRIADMIGKKFTIHCSGKFDFHSAGKSFDFALAQSVFTHLPNHDIETCMRNLTSVMKKGSQFIFTYIIGQQIPIGFLYSGQYPMQRGNIESGDWFKPIASANGIHFEDLPDFHPSGQKVGRFVF